MEKKGNPGPAPNPNTNPAPSPNPRDLEAALLELVQRLNSNVQSGRALSAKARAAITNYRGIAFLLNTSPLLDDQPGVGGTRTV